MSLFQKLFGWMYPHRKDSKIPEIKTMAAAKPIVLKIPVATKATPKKNTPVAPKVPGTFSYLINDPTTPDLVTKVTEPTLYNLPKFTVSNYKQNFSPTLVSKEGRAAGVLYSFYNELTWLSRIKPVTKWAATSTLLVATEAGVDLNAYYDRKSIRYFYCNDPVLRKTIYMCNSADIVCHELGHAVLDFYQPKMWSAAALEIWAFHESFSDLMAILTVMQSDLALNRAIAETSGDLSKTNVLAKLAEEAGLALHNMTKGKEGESRCYLRCAVNNYNYKDPKTLPRNAPDTTLSSEPHSFSRIFTGAAWDIFVTLYKDKVRQGSPPLFAAQFARDRLAKYLVQAVIAAPLNTKYYETVAKMMLWVDSQHFNNEYYYRMKSIFGLRNIIPATIRIMDAPLCDNDDNMVVKDNTKVVKLANHLILSQGTANPLYDVEVEIPQADVFIYDTKKQLIEQVTITDEEAFSVGQDMIEYLHEKKAVSDDPSTPFEIIDNKLVRTYFNS